MQLWLDRRKKIAALSSTEFIATAVFSELVQTMGEWLGTLLAIIGAGVGLIAAVTLGSDIDQLFRMLGLGFMQAGVLIILVGPVTGFFIIIVSRFLAEQMRLWVSLVNNTGEIAANLQKNLFAERLRVWVSLVNSVKEIAANVKGSANSGRPAAK
jgi:hypothetical protein